MGLIGRCLGVWAKGLTTLPDPLKLNANRAFGLAFAHKFPREKGAKDDQNRDDDESRFHSTQILGGVVGIGNEFLFELRRRLPGLRSKPYRESLPHALRETATISLLSPSQAFGLSESALRQNLIYGEILKQIPLPTCEAETFRVVDIGSRHFVYAPILARWLESATQAPRIKISGLEVDPYVLYFDLYRRMDLGRYYASLAASQRVEVLYEEGDWLTWPVPHRLDLVTCLFPYLVPDLHRKDRLPQKAYNPLGHYQKIFESTKFAIFFHQGEEEASLSKALMERLPQVRIQGELTLQKTAYGSRKHPVYVIWAQV